MSFDGEIGKIIPQIQMCCEILEGDLECVVVKHSSTDTLDIILLGEDSRYRYTLPSSDTEVICYFNKDEGKDKESIRRKLKQILG